MTDASAVAGDASAGPAASLDAGVVQSAELGDASVRAADVEFPMRQIGQGTVIHFPIPEQLARTQVPVFVQIRSTAPTDHVTLFYRSVGARTYNQLRMNPMGQAQRLPSGYGAMIPCEDIFPPRLEYYVEAYDSSGSANGTAGSAEAPVQLAIVQRRSFPAPALPGEAAPRTCGALTVAATARDSGVAAEPERGTADLGEPCRVTNDCHRGLRCGTNGLCIVDR